MSVQSLRIQLVSAALLVALACIPSVTAAPDAAPAAGDQILDAIAGGFTAVGEGLAAAGNGIKDAGSAAGSGIAAGVAFIARQLAGAVVGSAAAALALSAGLQSAFMAALQLVGAAAGAVGSAAATALVLVGAGLQAVAAMFAALGRLYGGFLEALKPARMDWVTYNILVAGSGVAAGTTGAVAVWAALKKWGLLAGGAVGGFSRIQDSDLLEHPVRADLYSRIQTAPGVHASQLARTLEVGWGTVTHHLQKLEKGKLVTTRKVNNHKCYFENGGMVARGDMAVASAVKNDTAARIASFVAQNPLASQKDVAGHLELSAALVSFHVKKLAALGVLEKIRHGKQTLLTTTEAMRRVVASAPQAMISSRPDEHLVAVH